MRTTTSALAALVVGLALTGCADQALVGQNAVDPVVEQVSPEEAREMAPEVHKESTHGEGGGGGH